MLITSRSERRFPMKRLRQEHPYLVLLFFALFLYLLGNNLLAVTDTSESNYALTAKEMVQSGDWISPQIFGRYWYDKPIFYYWELALSFKLFGFNEFAARFPSAVMGTLSLLFTYWFANRAYDAKTAWRAAVILGTSTEFFLLSKAVITDASLFLFTSAAIAFFYLGYKENARYYYGCYLFAALATLTKDPIGLFLPGFAALVFLFLKKDLHEFMRLHFFSGMMLFFSLTGLWYGTMYCLHGADFLINFLGVHNVLRATVSEHPGQNKWYFYLIVYAVGFLPWSFILPVSLYKKWKRHDLQFRKAADITRLLLIYMAVILIFFELVATKYSTYTFPALFSFAILSAVLWKDAAVPVKAVGASCFAIYIALTLLFAPTIMLRQSGKEIGTQLRVMDTTAGPICFDGFYRTSAVFYSDKKIYATAPAADLEKLKPHGLSWNAKNVMPMMAIEGATTTPGSTLVREAQKPITPALFLQQWGITTAGPGDTSEETVNKYTILQKK